LEHIQPMKGLIRHLLDNAADHDALIKILWDTLDLCVVTTAEHRLAPRGGVNRVPPRTTRRWATMRVVNPHRPASFAVALAFVAACGTHAAGVHKARDAASTGTAPVPAGAGGNDASYLATGPGRVLYVRWTATGAALTGAIDQVDASTSAAAGTSPVEESLTGVRNDDRVSLTLSEGLGTYKTITGSISGDELTLTLPNSAGILTDTVLRKATADDYNAAVAPLAARHNSRRPPTRKPPRQRNSNSNSRQRNSNNNNRRRPRSEAPAQPSRQT